MGKLPVLFCKERHILMCDFNAVSSISNSSIKINSLESQFQSFIHPEIWKDRPVIILFAHARMSAAVVIPLTSKIPQIDTDKFIHIPKYNLCGLLNKKESWALCDMPMTVSFSRLTQVYSGDKKMPLVNLHSTDAKLEMIYFNQIKEKIKNIFSL